MRLLVYLYIGILVLFSGCATDGIYQAGKTIYIAGKKVVIENWDELPEGTKEKLKKIDKTATKYDRARSIIKPAIEEAKKEVKKSADLNSTAVQGRQSNIDADFNTKENR